MNTTNDINNFEKLLFYNLSVLKIELPIDVGKYDKNKNFKPKSHYQLCD